MATGWQSNGYPSDWDRRRKRAYRRDNYECEVCGARGGPRGNAELHAHHIIPKSNGGSNSLNNLTTLCHYCHNLQHSHHVPKNDPNASSGGWQRPRYGPGGQSVDTDTTTTTNQTTTAPTTTDSSYSYDSDDDSATESTNSLTFGDMLYFVSSALIAMPVLYVILQEPIAGVLGMGPLIYMWMYSHANDDEHKLSSN